MSADRLDRPSEKSGFIRQAASWLLIIPSAIIGVLLVELFGHLFLPSIANSQSEFMALRRVIFFDGRGTIFRNEGDIFTYLPNNEVRNLTAFFSDSDFTVAYDYHFRTNNLGLVQDADVFPERASLLLLGDSFTEGQGAEPWFRLVAPEIEKLGYQPINGGLLGTGFEQWLKLDRDLSRKDFRIRKVVVLFISDDYQRKVWNFLPPVFQCLSTLTLCHIDESYFYRLPPQDELPSWIAKIRAARTNMSIKFWLKTHAEALLPVTDHVFRYLAGRLKNAGSSEQSHEAKQQSRGSIAELISKYGPQNVIFFHLPQREEIGHGPDDLGLEARRAIQQAGGTLFDGFKLCGLSTADYYSSDEHPNSSGYAKIASCVNSVIGEAIGSAH